MPNFLPTSSGMGKNPYTAQTSQASSSVSLQDLNQRIVTPPQHADSWDSLHNEDLPEPVLPWMKSESRQSLGSRTSVDTTSLHVMKRQMPDPAVKKKQRWSKHKWWLLVSNTIVGPPLFKRERERET